MKYGFVCSDYKEIDVAKELGFDGVELSLHNVPFLQPSLDPAIATDEEVLAMKKEMDSKGMKVLSGFYGKDLMEVCGMDVELSIKELTRAMEMTKMLGSDRFSLNCWVDPSASVEEQENYVKAVYTKLGETAEKEDMYIAIENCPHGGKNFVASPATMKRFKELVPNKRVGFEFDPSHMVWQGCDYMQSIREVKDYVFSFHAKDTQVMEQILKQNGILGAGWWRYRLPGWGQIAWKDLITELLCSGYDGPIIIEHEDPVFDGELRKKGLKMGLDYLKDLMG